MKRSNRLVLLIGVFLAVIAFIAVIFLPGQADEPRSRQKRRQPTVVAAADIPLGVKVTADMVTNERPRRRAVEARPPSATRARSSAGSSASPSLLARSSPPRPSASDHGHDRRHRGAADQASASRSRSTRSPASVRSIKPGDYVDMVVGIPSDKFPVITTNPADDSFTVVAGINGTSVKLLLQGMQVLGTLLPPPPLRTTSGQEGQPPPERTAGHGAQRPAGDRHPRGRRPAGRSHQVRPARRRHLA